MRTKKNTPIYITILLIVFTLTSSSFAQAAPGDLEITQVTELIFGSFTTDNTGGTVTLKPETESRVISDNVIAISSITPQRAEYTITGAPFETVIITLPNDGMQLDATPDNSGSTGQITEFTSFPEDFLVLDANGEATLYVGGTATITSQTERVELSSNFDIQVDYATIVE